MDFSDFWRLLDIGLLALAFFSLSAANVRTMIRLYQLQSLLLIAIAIGARSLRLAAAPPFILAAVIELMLARATVPQAVGWRRYLSLTYWEQLHRQAAAIWLRRNPRGLPARLVLLNLVVVLITVGAAFPLEAAFSQSRSGIDGFSLTVALGLVALGLVALSTRGDLIEQVMGLLITEYGLFLAVVRLAPESVGLFFVFSLFVYILLTLLLLVVLLPELRRVSGSPEVEAQRELRG